MSLTIRTKYVFATLIVAVSVMILGVLVPANDAEAVDGPVPLVFVARSDDFADALAGGPLASLRGAPLLLTRTDTLEANTADELSRLKPDRIIILGGPVAISEATEAQLEPYAGAGGVDRIQGGDRFETAALIAAALPSKAHDADKLDGLDSTAFLGSNAKAADADKLDGLDSSAFAPAAVVEPFVVQLALDTFVVVAENGPLKVAAFCQNVGGTAEMSMRVSSTVAGAYNEDDSGTFGPADGWVDINDSVNPGPGEYDNAIDEGVAIARADGRIYAVSVDGEINGFGESIYDHPCTVNGLVNSYSGPAGLTPGASPTP